MAKKMINPIKCVALLDIFVVEDEEGKRLSDIAYCDEDGNLEEGCELLIRKGEWLVETGESDDLIHFRSWSPSNKKNAKNQIYGNYKKLSLPWYCVKRLVQDITSLGNEFWIKEIEKITLKGKSKMEEIEVEEWKGLRRK